MKWACLFLVFAACAQDPGRAEFEPPDAGAGVQASYEYPGCPNEDAEGLPHLKTIFCAVQTIEARYATACTDTADCIHVEELSPDCIGYLPCGGFINKAHLAEFTAEAEQELSLYCADAGFRGFGDCPATVPVCRNGFCTWEQDFAP